MKSTKKQKIQESSDNVKGLSLLKKSKRGIFSVIFSRLGIITLLLLLQVFVLFGIFTWFTEFLPHFYVLYIVFALVMMVYLLNSRTDPTAKITWLIIITVLPVFGVLLYLYTKTDVGHRTVKKRVHEVITETKDTVPQNADTFFEVQKNSPELASLRQYINRSGCFPVFRGCDVMYFPTGEAKFEVLLQKLKEAKHFIFLEYFIIDEGTMWGQVLEILAEKAAQGVDVRVMYDGTCEFSNLPRDYPKRLRKLGIQCKVFAPVTPFVSTHYNYRDHRKILVVDGQCAFTGGINLADEYINQIVRFGYWKDTAVMVEGDAVRSFTLMFLQMWALNEKNTDFNSYLTPVPPKSPAPSGYVMPYGDCPLDSDKVGEHVYMNMLYHAEKRAYIMTPYLILDGKMEDALKFAAERGVDVRIILPGIPDKKVPYALAITHYATLMESGVRIFEYTPGFVHAKVFVCDGTDATVGTVNLDYRSLYHHFECGTYLQNVSCIPDIEADFLKTQADCHEVTAKDIKRPSVRRTVGYLMKALSPLL